MLNNFCLWFYSSKDFDRFWRAPNLLSVALEEKQMSNGKWFIWAQAETLDLIGSVLFEGTRSALVCMEWFVYFE